MMEHESASDCCDERLKAPQDAVENVDDVSIILKADFARTKEAGKWPNMFDEASMMLGISILTYGVAELRSLTRKGKLDAKGIFELPMSVSHFAHIWAHQLEDVKRIMEPTSFDAYMTGLILVIEEIDKKRVNAEDDGMIIIFDDENSHRELVYGIVVNPVEQRITVTFRGSVTLNDIIIDTKVNLVQIPNPLQPGKTVGIHNGFRDYLYGKPCRNSGISSTVNSEAISSLLSTKRSQTDKQRKIDTILDRLFGVVDKYPQYRIAITGHSLGGSLAMLVAFELAGRGDSRIEECISCISFAAPRVGNIAFANAFQTLERTNKIRCLRVVNERDLFPEIPRIGTLIPCGITCYFGNQEYHHVGVSVVLQRNGGHAIYVPLHLRSFRDWLRRAQTTGQSLRWLMSGENLAANHGCKEYWTRLHQNEIALKQLFLNQMYHPTAERRLSAFSGRYN